MIPGMNPRLMKQAMKKMGIQQEDIDAKEVIIRTADTEIIFSSPSVAKVHMMGQETWQITGEYEERALSSEPDISTDDINAVVEQTGVTAEKAKETILAHKGDLAAAILELQKE